MASEQEFSRAEAWAIERHRQELCQQWGRAVDFDTARSDWLTSCAPAWRAARMRLMLSLQREEINRYKWIESEKACRDLGREAVFDWINKYAADWRDWFEREFVEIEV